jgi:hypothetical protein
VAPYALGELVLVEHPHRIARERDEQLELHRAQTHNCPRDLDRTGADGDNGDVCRADVDEAVGTERDGDNGCIDAVSSCWCCVDVYSGRVDSSPGAT